ncbi:cysteine hydrolase family protein [Lysinibacillus sp. NPDC047702]|uniref:cysteine hydrolase family protein n=1 Tax=unclassified Lysinibacillus TaxID=2636778 RepID=UPI003D036E39
MKKALLILDIQNDYISDQARLPIAKQQMQSTISCINVLIQKAREQGIPIVYIRNEFEQTQISNLFRKFTALKGTKGAEFDERLVMVDGAYFSKNKADAFSNPDLATYLSQQKINELIVTGVFVEGCVNATVNGALARNFKVIVVDDAVGGATDKSKAAALLKLAKKDVLICTSQRILGREEVEIDTFTTLD